MLSGFHVLESVRSWLAYIWFGALRLRFFSINFKLEEIIALIHYSDFYIKYIFKSYNLKKQHFECYN